MKKIAGILLGIMGMVLLSGCSIKDSFMYENADKYTAGSAQIDATIKDLDIEWAAGDVVVKTGDVSEARIEEDAPDNLEEKNQMHWWLDGTTLRIKIYGKGKIINLGLEKTLTVTLPQDVNLRDVEIDVASAEVSVESLQAEEVEINSASGNVEFIGQAKAVNISTASGDIYADCMAEELELDTASGKIEVKEGGLLREAGIDTASGDVVIIAETFNAMEIETASGKITVKLPSDSNFTLDLDSASGGLHSDLALTTNGKRYVCGNGKASLSIDTASGDVFLKEK